MRFIGPVSELTQQQTTEFQFELRGSRESVSSALASYHPSGDEWQGDACRVNVRFAEPSELDAAIDRLRAAGVSIVGIVRRRVSLEDAFLKMIADSPKKL
jgi:hypothetical protein